MLEFLNHAYLWQMSNGIVKSIWKKQRMALISMAWIPSMVFTKRAMMEKKTVDKKAQNKPRPGHFFGFSGPVERKNKKQTKAESEQRHTIECGEIKKVDMREEKERKGALTGGAPYLLQSIFHLSHVDTETAECSETKSMLLNSMRPG